jgi:release factor glutamine methyltransferase
MTETPTANSIRALLKHGIDELRAAKVPSFTLAAELLLLHAANRDRTWIYSHPDDSLSDPAAEIYFSLLHRRATGEPTQHLTGKQEFWGLEFTVTPDVLIPRPETEHLIEVALDRLAVLEIRAGRDPRLTGENLKVVDIGTGSGCIAIALAKELPQAKICATDISAAALEVAKQNAARHNVADRIDFLYSNVLEVFSNAPKPASSALDASSDSPLTRHSPLPLFDLIVSNPPYIGLREAASLPTEVRDHEPAQALFGGPEGYELYANLVFQSSRHLKPNGLLVVELGHSSLPAVQPLLDSESWTNVLVTKDLAKIDRILSAERL